MGAELKENFNVSDPLGSTKDTLATGAATASNLATQFL